MTDIIYERVSVVVLSTPDPRASLHNCRASLTTVSRVILSMLHIHFGPQFLQPQSEVVITVLLLEHVLTHLTTLRIITGTLNSP